MRERLIVLFLEYFRSEYADSFDQLRTYLSGLEPPPTYVVIDNRREGNWFRRDADDVLRIGGDNRDWEFSGWQRGLDFVRDNSMAHDALLIANDSFLKPGPSYLARSPEEELRRCVRGRTAVGRIDSHGRSFALMGHRFADWMCTNCFLLPRSLAEALETLVSVDDEMLDRILPQRFSVRPLLRRRLRRDDFRGQKFHLSCGFGAGGTVNDGGGNVNLRIDSDRGFVPRDLGDSSHERELAFYVTECNLLERLKRVHHGWYLEDGKRGWIGRSASVSFVNCPTTLEVVGHVPSRVLEELYQGELSVEISCHSDYFSPDAQLGQSYREALLQWITERWHSRQSIVPGNWAFIRKKIQTILNEALLSARIRELGYRVESHIGPQLY